jgi:hypothetical protein
MPILSTPEQAMGRVGGSKAHDIHVAGSKILFVPKGFNTQEPAFRRGSFRARLLIMGYLNFSRKILELLHNDNISHTGPFMDYVTLFVRDAKRFYSIVLKELVR